MIVVSVTLENGMYFPMFVFVPTGSEIMRRLSLPRDWSYVMSGTHPNQISPFLINGDTVVENGTQIKLYKRSIEPILCYERLNDFDNRLRLRFQNEKDTRPILVWINYNIFYNPKEPLCLFFSYKKDGEWSMMLKTTDSFEEVRESMLYGNVFDVLNCVWDRYHELKEYYTV